MKRLLSLDILRGITVCGMILVNNAGGPVSYAPLRHSVWNGLTPCDLVFPFFLFMVGISTYISLRKFNFQPSKEVAKKIFRRMCLIILIGLGIEWFGYACDGNFFPVDTLRIPGVLQRIGLCYGIVSLMVVYLNHKYLPWITAGLLVVYSVLLLCGNGYACDDTNLIAIIDRSIFGEAHLYKKSPIDPEGLIGTVSSVAHTLIGFFCGKLLLEKTSVNQRIVKLIAAAAVMLVIGYVLSIWMPLNKRVWSTSFVLVTCGWGALLLSVLMYVIDVKNINKGWTFFLVFGMNPLFLYVLSEVVAIAFSQWHITEIIYNAINSIIPDKYFASLIYALLFCSLMCLTGYILHRKKIYIKI
ncbi:acyltransferase family protein [Phocaeicola sp.]|uniref:acyltransferase family protein n=1 Tax=Phocaeicola sp. TaxID=2773926 RepID=UPI003A95C253